MISAAPTPADLSAELRYEQISASVEALIEKGTLRPGDRVPSVREMARQQRASISTVLHAYRQLESKGLIEARPQSGYYVSVRKWTPPAEPETTRPARHATQVNVTELSMRVLHAIGNPKLVRLGAALPSPELLPSHQLSRCIAAVSRRHRDAGNIYLPPAGDYTLRTQVARRALSSGCTLAPEEIIVTCGCTEALSICLRAITRPGDTVAIESPTFFGILQTIEALGLKALEIPTHPRDGVSLEALAKALDSKPVRACLFQLNHNNPLGSAMPDESKRQLVEMLAEREIPLIEDDIYGDLTFMDVRPRTAKSYDTRGLVILCDSFSKTLAPGYRVGWCVPGRWAAEVERHKMVNTLTSSTLPQLAVAEFLREGGYDRHLRRIRKLYAEKVRRVSQAVTEYFPAGSRITRPKGGHVLWVELPEAVDSLELFDRALASNISIAPGPIFSASGRFRNFLRLNCGNPWTDRIDDALQSLGRLAGRLLEQG